MEKIGRTAVLLLVVSLCMILYVHKGSENNGPKSQKVLPPTASSAGRVEEQQPLAPYLNGRGHVCNVLDYGARATGEDFDTHALQRAIDDCATGDGGLVYVPPGDYLTATLYLRSNIVLYIEQNATIYGSPNQSDYPAEYSRWYVILADSVENVEITGGGTVDGQAEKFVVRYDTRKNIMVSWNQTGDCKGDECRPRLLGFIDSRNIRVKDVFLHQPAYWCLHTVRCNHVVVEGVKIFGDFNIPNNDGIDIQDTNNTRIVNCRIDTGDDAICPKTISGPLFNLTVSDSWIRTKSSAVKFGSDSRHDFHHLRFERLTIVDSHRGLALQLRDEGSISDVVFSDIVLSTRYYDPSWWGGAEPIYITACPRGPSTLVGSISDIQFINIVGTSENGVFLSGSPHSILRRINLQNVTLSFVAAGRSDITESYHDYRPGCQGLVSHNSSGIFVEYAKDVSFEDVTVNWASNLDWDTPFEFTPKSVGRISLSNVVSATFSSDFPFLTEKSGVASI
ncbi:hypothetical protein R1sor_023840 [Riccia sorocarpa]|uniref:Pectate lyase superfamily protein domain-containing protein n=1 Tax=Riccia sorocarpa TaxID=122646 RepID=A0ABD3GUP4_9MARC